MAAAPRDYQRLRDVHPRLIWVVLTLLDQYPLFVVEGVRTAERQHQLWRQGREIPGPVVTTKDGYTARSRHQIDLVSAYGIAVDLAWLGSAPFALSHPWADFGASAKALGGIVWGGDFAGLVDRPHLELSPLA